MTSVSKLKDEARRHEQREEWDRAIEVYKRVLRGADQGENEVDLPLFNRIGDLHVRLGRPAEAVAYYEQAADRYGEAGLYNNAIALCNKALRYAPHRLALLRKLGRFSALQGFNTDARRWFVHFSERMFAQGAVDEALEGLREFANVSEEPDARELLAEELLKRGRADDAFTEYRRAFSLRIAAGDAEGGAALRARVLELFPDVEELTPEPIAPQPGAESETEEGEQLPSLSDGGGDTRPHQLPSLEDRVEPKPGPAAGPDRERPAGPAAPPLPTDTVESAVARAAAQGMEPIPGLEATHLDDAARRAAGAEALPGFESTAIAGDLAPAGGHSVDDLVGGAHGAGAEGGPGDASLEALRDAYDATEDDTTSDHGSMPLPLLDAPPGPPRQQEPEPLPPLPDLPPIDTNSLDRDAKAHGSGSGYIDLFSLIDPEEGRSTDTRFRVEETEPTGDEDHDFAELLRQFKAKLAEAVEPDDAASHYDLGLAFKEMGLVDEAISEFQRAMRSGDHRLKILEELGQCFIAKGQLNVAVRVLETALRVDAGDELELIGVYYHVGRAYEGLGRTTEAREAYERVLALDIEFEDVTERIVRL